MYNVASCNFDFHPVLEADTYWRALTLAKERGFQARITFSGELVAVWCPLFGVTTYNRELAK